MDDLTDIVVFVRVVEAKSFTAAAERLGIAKSVVSKYVTRLEERLGARLLNRTTRRLSLTEAGAALYERSRLALEEIAETERCVGIVQAAPRGTLKLNAPMSFGILHLGPALPEFLMRYPEITLDVSYNDRFVDVIEEGYDVTLRIISALPDSTLVARSLTPVHFVVCAAPRYLERAGVPETPEDLMRHNCLLFTLTSGNEWHFDGPGWQAQRRGVGQLSVQQRHGDPGYAVGGDGGRAHPDLHGRRGTSERRAHHGAGRLSNRALDPLCGLPLQPVSLAQGAGVRGFPRQALCAARPVGSRHGCGTGSLILDAGFRCEEP